MTPRVVTGLGITCALGTGADVFFEAMRAPERLSRRPPAPITSFDASKYEEPLPIVEVPAFDPTKYLGDKGLRVLDRLTKLLVVAARLCLQNAGIKKEGGEWTSLGPDGVGVCCSNAYGSLEAITELDRVAVLEDARYINPAKFPNTVSNSASGYVSIWEDLRALNVTVSDGNCGALDAVACADIFLETGRAEAILTGGGEAMSEALWLAFERLGALREAAGATRSARDRAAGAVNRLGEGACFLALESPAAAAARGARTLGVIIGSGTAFVAPSAPSLLHASREAVERAIAQALADAKIGANDVDLVASSVSGLERFDAAELAGIASAVGDVAVAAPKFLLGETLGACGAMSMAAALAWLAGSPPTALVRGAAPPTVRTILVTTIGYYGNASAVVMRRP